jgi:hypothetical protein
MIPTIATATAAQERHAEFRRAAASRARLEAVAADAADDTSRRAARPSRPSLWRRWSVSRPQHA